MTSLHEVQTVILLLIAVLVLTAFARKLAVPYPIFLVIGGSVLGLIPGLPVVRLRPDLVFLVVLPPILWSAAYLTSWRDFRANLRPILLYAFGLVLVTAGAVGFVATTLMPGIGWAAAVALGAVVAPPDAVSASAIAHRLRIPPRIVTILEGESLVNDATALVLYRSAVVVAMGVSFSLVDITIDFFVRAAAGIAIGLAVGFVTRWALNLVQDSFSDVVITLLSPYIAWVVAEELRASQVLACVAGGLFLRNYGTLITPVTRIQARAVWQLLVFLLNGVAFVLIGLQLGALRHDLPVGQFGPLLFNGAIITLTVIVVRLLWVPVAAWVPRALSPSLRARDPMPPWQQLFFLGWTGMRGIVSLAAALALPLTLTDGRLFPFRSEIILISFMVVLVTLVLQGLSLPWLIRLLKLEEKGIHDRAERHARAQTAAAALARLDTLTDENASYSTHIERLRVHYGQRHRRYASSELIEGECTAEDERAYRAVRHHALTAERRALIALRDEGVINDELFHRLEHELDVEALRLGLGEVRSTS